MRGRERESERVEYRERQDSLEKLSKYVERARRMEGWDLDEVQREAVGPCPSWGYSVRAGELVADARAILDMGTGGGEVFSTICEGYTGLAVATEAWIPISWTQLKPLRLPRLPHIPHSPGYPQGTSYHLTAKTSRVTG